MYTLLDLSSVVLLDIGCKLGTLDQSIMNTPLDNIIGVFTLGMIGVFIGDLGILINQIIREGRSLRY